MLTPLPAGRGVRGGPTSFCTPTLAVGLRHPALRAISASAALRCSSCRQLDHGFFPTALGSVHTLWCDRSGLPVANIGSREILGETRQLTEQGKGVCVGRPVAGMEVRVVRITDEPIAEWNDSLLAPPGESG